MTYILFNADIRSILHLGCLLIPGLSASGTVSPLCESLSQEICGRRVLIPWSPTTLTTLLWKEEGELHKQKDVYVILFDFFLYLLPTARVERTYVRQN